MILYSWRIKKNIVELFLRSFHKTKKCTTVVKDFHFHRQHFLLFSDHTSPRARWARARVAASRCTGSVSRLHQLNYPLWKLENFPTGLRVSADQWADFGIIWFSRIKAELDSVTCLKSVYPQVHDYNIISYPLVNCDFPSNSVSGKYSQCLILPHFVMLQPYSKTY